MLSSRSAKMRNPSDHALAGRVQCPNPSLFWGPNLDAGPFAPKEIYWIKPIPSHDYDCPLGAVGRQLDELLKRIGSNVHGDVHNCPHESIIFRSKFLQEPGRGQDSRGEKQPRATNLDQLVNSMD